MDEQSTLKVGDRYQYAGFWSRVGAAVIDTVILCMLTYPILVAVYGWAYFDSDAVIQGGTDFVLSWLFPLIAVLSFWVYRQATPGKMAIRAKIVDANTGDKPSLRQYLIRYLGYIVATLPLGLGILWVAWDKRKQGWHDKLANTVVIGDKERTAEVAFSSNSDT
ncbi:MULTISPECIES: RDD family protein [Vibrio]|jgi:uncharacterized RDD family membrane protein YckC|uniref:RDD family protein n=1 Tax=Vibrio europaeus TaxID=300876 RepID=A0AAE7AZD3_9VIBR|nr:MULTISPECIES: RDD family protein [Vibrio]KLN65943.1 hypothetical protein ZX61_06055 [Vibrio sp. VPAP30]MCG9579489.1 RDD family protein [Vibrio tubiashii]MCG9583560.1 RDD family protein [Vibrio tubiashii]MCG9617137.1 RDD family protein [Vibrio tubiashii]MCG9688662.1 RDD family protein [Vibrio tubiashii]